MKSERRMRAEERASSGEETVRRSAPADRAASRTGTAPSRDGREIEAPSGNGHGGPVKAERRDAAPPRDPLAFARHVRETTDWNAFLPERAGSWSWKLQQGAKRVIDVVVSLVGLIVLSPILAALALLVKLTSPGPAFYRWRVLGHRARPFVGFKFRSMVENADELKLDMDHLNHMDGPAFKIRNDPRVTPVGRWLRKSSLDELPQLWSVLKGDMSLVGPRPPFPEEFVEFQDWHRAKLAVKPGITCYWQVQGRSDISDFDEWAKLDLKYIREWNLWVDLKILLRTIPVVIRGHGAY